MFTKHTLITPKMAKDMLKANVHNRTVKDRRVKEWARDMLNGRWQENGETIKFYEDGTLADGQHRLMAIVLADVPVAMGITYGLKKDVTVFDAGVKRTDRDLLELLFGKLAGRAQVSGAIRLIYRTALGDTNAVISRAELEEFASAHTALLLQAARMCKDTSGSLTNRVGCVAAAFCAMFEGINPNTLERFFYIANKGFYDYANETAAIVLKNYLTKEIGSKKRSCEEDFLQTTNAINDYVNHTPRIKKYSDSRTPLYTGGITEWIKENLIGNGEKRERLQEL